jgi:NAD(P)-dependent dehydrogenase (short-subunit alcohol dehydrogenase family)
MNELRGRTALVTGASGGIGVYVARAGMNVGVSGRREDALASVVEELRAIGVHAESVPADLFDLTKVESLIDRSEAVVADKVVEAIRRDCPEVVESGAPIPTHARACPARTAACRAHRSTTWSH